MEEIHSAHGGIKKQREKGAEGGERDHREDEPYQGTPPVTHFLQPHPPAYSDLPVSPFKGGWLIRLQISQSSHLTSEYSYIKHTRVLGDTARPNHNLALGCPNLLILALSKSLSPLTRNFAMAS